MLKPTAPLKPEERRQSQAGSAPPRRPPRTSEAAGEESEGEGEEDSSSDEGPAAWDADRDVVDISEEYRARLLSYRMSEELRGRVDSLLQRFHGPLNYFNFTRHKRMKDREDKVKWRQTFEHITAASAASNPSTTPSALPARPKPPSNQDFHADRNMRVLLDCGVDHSFIHPQSGLELLVLRLHGQSFMLNQIRKMVGLVVLMARGTLPEELWTKVFRQKGLFLPTAPSNGLYLDRLHFEKYDRKCDRKKDDDDRIAKKRQKDGVEAKGNGADGAKKADGEEDDEDGEGSERPPIQAAYELHEKEIQGTRQQLRMEKGSAHASPRRRLCSCSRCRVL